MAFGDADAIATCRTGAGLSATPSAASVSASNVDVVCGVCDDSVGSSLALTLWCGHTFCTDCWAAHAESCMNQVGAVASMPHLPHTLTHARVMCVCSRVRTRCLCLAWSLAVLLGWRRSTSRRTLALMRILCSWGMPTCKGSTTAPLTWRW